MKNKYPDAFFTGKDLFSAGTFANPRSTSVFYTFIAELFHCCASAQPTRTHHFIRKLEQKGKLLRNYTQNIDGFERRMGLESGGRGKGLKKKGTRNVELHGDLGRVRCVLCFSDFEACDEWVEMFREGEAPDCPACWKRCTCKCLNCILIFFWQASLESIGQQERHLWADFDRRLCYTMNHIHWGMISAS